MSAPAKKAPKKAAAKSPRAARPAPEPAEDAPQLTDEELAALTDAVPVVEDGEIRPVIIGKRGRRGDTPVEMVTLFVLDDVPHQIPRNPSAALVLRFLLDLREHGRFDAIARMATTLLGKDALDRLSADPEVEPEDVAEIFTNIGTVFFTSENYNTIIEASDPS